MDEEQRKLYSREYYHAHKETMRAQNKAYKEAHREELRQKRRERYAANKEQEIQQVMAYKTAHREQANSTQRRYVDKNRDEVNQKRRERSALHREELNAKQRAYNAANRERLRAYNKLAGKKSRQQQRLEVLQHYSNAEVPFCACCGESTIEFLAIDHIDGNGNKHRKEIGISAAAHMYNWLKKNNFPPGFQVLCHNCNTAKGLYGSCPHQLTKKFGD